MIPASFDYEVADSLDRALSLLAEGGDEAKPLAGGHSLLPLMKLRFARPTVLVDLGRLDELAYIRDAGDDGLAIGALTRHHDIQHSEAVREACPLLAHVAGLVGDPQVRHRGTIGGAIAHGDPASDPPSALLALDARIAVRGPGGEREIAAADFFQGLFETALEPTELVTEIRIPRPPKDHGWSYVKFNRRAQDWAVVGAAVVLDRSDGGISRASVALTNMGHTPLRAREVEARLAESGGGDDRAQAIAAAAAEAAAGTSPPSDVHATPEYRKHLATVVVRRALGEALAR